MDFNNSPHTEGMVPHDQNEPLYAEDSQTAVQNPRQGMGREYNLSRLIQNPMIMFIVSDVPYMDVKPL